MVAKLKVQEFIHIGIFTMFVSIVQLSYHVQGNVSPGQDCGSRPPRGKIHVMDNGTYRCCVEVTCHLGYYAVLCKSEESEASCEKCPAGHFMEVEAKSSAMLKCKQHARCDSNKNLVVRSNGSSTSDTLCECFLEGGYFRNQTMFIGTQPRHDYPCTSYKECPPGKELNQTGYCNPCAKYWMFKDYSGVGSCKTKIDCSVLGLEFESLSAEDTSKNNVCKNKTLKATELHYAVPIVSVVGAVLLVTAVIVILLYKRHTGERNVNLPEPEKTLPPDDSDTDSGHHSNIVDYTRQFSADSFTEEKQLLSTGLIHEKPHISLPVVATICEQRPGSVTTPDSAFYDGPQSLCGHDLVTDSQPADQAISQESMQHADQGDQYNSTSPDINGKQGTIQVVVTGSHCNVHVGDKVVRNIYNSSEDLDGPDDENVNYAVTEQPCFNSEDPSPFS